MRAVLVTVACGFCNYE